MSAIRNFALAAVAAAALAGSAQAQGTVIKPGNRPVAGRGHHDGAMGGFNRLNLTEAQKTQIKAIHAKYATQLRAARDQAKPFLDAARDARQKGDTAAFRANLEKARGVSSAVRQQEMNEIRAVLTPAQRAQADSLMAQRKAHAGKRGFARGEMRGRAGWQGTFKTLNLTDAQKAQIKAIRAKYQGQAKTTREQEMNEIRAVLTADQRAKLDSAAAQRKQEFRERGAKRGLMRKGGK